MRACCWNSSAAARMSFSRTLHSEPAKKIDGRAGLQFLQENLRRRARGAGEVGDAFAGGDHAEPRVSPGQTFEQSGEAGIFEAPRDLRPPRRVLQRLNAVEHEEGPFLPDQPGETGSAVIQRAGFGVRDRQRSEARGR